MIDKSIKTKGQQKKVVNELVKDLRKALGIYECYSISKEDDDRVEIFSMSFCPIITDSCFSSFLKVYNTYEVIYPSISYHIDAIEHNGKIKPTIEVIINTSNLK